MNIFPNETICGPTLMIEEPDQDTILKIRRAAPDERENNEHTLFIIREDVEEEDSLDGSTTLFNSMFLTREQVIQVRDHLNRILEED